MSFVAGYTLSHLDHYLIAPAELPPLYHWQRCAHCGSLGPYICDRPMLKPKRVLAETLNPGDVIWRQKRPDRKARVLALEHDERIHSSGGHWLWLTIKKLSGSKATKRVELVPTSVVVTYRPFPCEKVCCERCVRELADNRHCCVDHWHEFESETFTIPDYDSKKSPARSAASA